MVDNTEMFHTLVADPPWSFGDKLPGPKRGAVKHYSTMSLEQIECSLYNAQEQLGQWVSSNARLFLWRPASMQQEAIRIMEDWGFNPKAELIWVKLTKSGLPWFGMGHQVRNSHETCLIGTRGRPERLSASVRSVFSAKVGKHSEKPSEFYNVVRELSPGPYLELFARRNQEGWTCLGDELGVEL